MFQLSRLLLFPESLIFLVLYATAAFAQPQPLALNQSLLLSSSSLSSSTFSLPKSSTSLLTVSVALCDAPANNNDGPRFFVTNNTAVSDPGPDSSESDVFEIVLGGNGIGNFTMDVPNGGGVFAVDVEGAARIFEVGVTDSGPLHEQLISLPLLGDTTANQALLFSPSFDVPSPDMPTYPNFTLPIANLTSPTPPNQFPNFTLLVGPIGAFPEFDFIANIFKDGLPVTACALQNLTNLVVNSGSFGNVKDSLVFRGADGWRTQWLVQGLQPLTNYTVYVIQDGVKVSGPINFVTKSASFDCPLVHSLPYCPLTSYAVPLPEPPFGIDSYDASSLPDGISGPLLSYMTNFTTSLLTFACGRDWYSPLVDCQDCQTAYRTWLCAVQLPRCGEVPPNPTSTPSSTPSKRAKRADSAQATLAAPALSAQNTSTTARNANLPAFPGGNWTELLPCLETCNAAERACPPFLQFMCPVPRFTAGDSYGMGFIDGDASNPGGTWKENGGSTGAAQDRWGNVWCNGPGLAV
ncbi:stretch-activated cation channel Mid1 [Phellopilus nigrolimitatus]|nr:stretch-activated cation channel Mid1 [Phellopilus nigrolimitatus]